MRVVIVTGRFALECTALREHPASIAFYLSPLSKDACQARHLQSQNVWRETEQDLFADVDSLRTQLEAARDALTEAQQHIEILSGELTQARMQVAFVAEITR